MYDEIYFAKEHEYEFQKINNKQEIQKIISLYLEKYFNIQDDKQTWFDKIKEVISIFLYLLTLAL